MSQETSCYSQSIYSLLLRALSVHVHCCKARCTATRLTAAGQWLIAIQINTLLLVEFENISNNVFNEYITAYIGVFKFAWNWALNINKQSKASWKNLWNANILNEIFSVLFNLSFNRLNQPDFQAFNRVFCGPGTSCHMIIF